MSIKKLLEEYGVSGLEEGDVSAIERMIEENFTLNEPWILVSENVPSLGDDVYLFDELQGVVLGYYDAELESFVSDETLSNVTHWMPHPGIPRMPKKRRQTKS